jgi:hypothetical protein
MVSFSEGATLDVRLPAPTACERDTSNDVAIIWPTRRKPVLITSYLTGSPANPGKRDTVIAECGQKSRIGSDLIYFIAS